MELQELDNLLRAPTRREQYYLAHPGAPSPLYKTLKRRTVGGQDVLCFKLPTLKKAEILIRKDSRFTSVPYYIHSNLNINFLYSGKCDYEIDGRPITLRQGDVAIFDRDVIRRKYYAGENDIVINVSMSNEFFDNSFLRQIGEQSILSSFMLHVLSTQSPSHNHYMIFQSHRSPIITILFERLLLEYFDNRLYGKEMIRGYLHLVFTDLLRLYHEAPDSQLIEISSGQIQNTIEILRYIEQHYEDCTLTQLAETFGYHPKYLCSLLKKQTGKSFKQIQMEKRLKTAASLLENSDLPIQSILQQVGAHNQSFFYRCFEEAYTVSPGEYRRQHRL